jgi:hypothetical protein
MTRDQWQDRFAREAVKHGAEPGEAAALAVYFCGEMAKDHGPCPRSWPKPESAASEEFADA